MRRKSLLLGITARKHGWVQKAMCNSKTQGMKSLQNQVSCSLHLRHSISSRRSLFDVAILIVDVVWGEWKRLRFHGLKAQVSVSIYPMPSSKSKQEEEKKDMYTGCIRLRNPPPKCKSPDISSA